ncbi:MAG: DUF4344 domain-containing metallopeptidase [Hyphomonadaceae bacterium]|jgi:hypothetical protein|nr:DUF4344 domain-containing metallopeptidase [Hyphomonadaceae bacterium]
MPSRAALAIFLCALVLGASAPRAQVSQSDRIAISYVAPVDGEHEPLYHMLMEQQALERVRDLLVKIRWPRTLRLELAGCQGESNAWYEDAVVTVCYEYLNDMWRTAHSSRRPKHLTPQEAFMGPAVDTFLHEAGHAAFDLLKVPVLGREEDAADQFAAYIVLHFPSEKKKALILGSAYSYASELRVYSARDLSKPRLGFGRHITYADEHGTPAQRLYNLLCIAYGSDKNLFADVVSDGYLPGERAEMCEDEYRQIDFAYRSLIEPHVDK